MNGMDLVVAGCILMVAVGAGLLAHEWAHALTLRLCRIEYTVSYFPGRDEGIAGTLRSCPWAVVEPRPSGTESAWSLRVAALAPFALALPVFVLGVTGPGLASHPPVLAAMIGWLACSIPSPQDFSVVFHAHELLEHTGDDDATHVVSCAD